MAGVRHEGLRSLGVLVLLVIAIGGAAQWWAARRDDELGRRLQRLAGPGDIDMVSSDTCFFCKRALAWLEARRIPYGVCSIERDPACAERYRALGEPGTPVILVRGQPQLGFSPERVLLALDQSPSRAGSPRPRR